MSERVQQRVVDPELCSACYACFEACPKGAVVIDGRRVAVDPALCELCGDCVSECATGAIDTLRLMLMGATFGIDEQLAWDRLPPDELVG